MKKKTIIEEKTSRIQTRMREMQKELERDLIEYVEEHGELDFTNLEYPIYTTLNMWSEVTSCRIEGVRVKHGVLLVVDESGQEHDYDDFTNDTLVDICYSADSWPTEE